MERTKTKKVCFFGIYDPEYSRNRILAKGLELHGYETVHCRVDPKKHGRFFKYWRLYQEYRRISSTSFEHVIVAFPGHTVVWLARLLFGKRIIFDAYVSLYDVNVFDRKLYSSRSFHAWKSWCADWISARLAWRILFDTYAHIEYFADTFNVPREKFIRVLIGADDEVLYPPSAREKERKSTAFRVHFHGSFIAVQGIPYIIDAAEILQNESIEFTIVGGGRPFSEIEKEVHQRKLSNVTLTGPVPFKEVAQRVAGADACLGIFGDTPKAQRVIPNKVYEYLAMKKAVISGETPAIRELFEDGEHMLLCKVADGAALAEQIQRLKDDVALRSYIAEEGFKRFKECATPRKIVEHLLADIQGAEAS